MEVVIVSVFIVGYLLIAMEHVVKINKAATALVIGVLCWTLFVLEVPSAGFTTSAHYQSFIQGLANLSLNGSETYRLFVATELAHHLSEISSIIFFLLGAMTIVELIDAHHGFRFITDRITTTDVRKLLWIICWVTFFASAILDNLTAAIVMVSLARKIVRDEERRLFLAGMIVIAANAGGAWSPMGDVTTTMLWIGGQITAASIIKSLFLPSVICLLIPLLFLTFKMKGGLEQRIEVGDITSDKDVEYVKGGKIMLAVGVGGLCSVPVFKMVTHLPPYLGMLLGLGVLWIVSELINPGLDEFEKKKYSVATALSRVDVTSVLFFLGILLAVGALQSMQTLHHFAAYLTVSIGDNRLIISLIGVVSAIVDNVPLVAAWMGMYPLGVYPADHMVWEYLAYCAGTGGSLLIIGSAAGVAVMGMEKIDFIWYVKKISFLALIGYVGGAIVYLIIR